MTNKTTKGLRMKSVETRQDVLALIHDKMCGSRAKLLITLKDACLTADDVPYQTQVELVATTLKLCAINVTDEEKICLIPVTLGDVIENHVELSENSKHILKTLLEVNPKHIVPTLLVNKILQDDIVKTLTYIASNTTKSELNNIIRWVRSSVVGIEGVPSWNRPQMRKPEMYMPGQLEQTVMRPPLQHHDLMYINNPNINNMCQNGNSYSALPESSISNRLFDRANIVKMILTGDKDYITYYNSDSALFQYNDEAITASVVVDDIAAHTLLTSVPQDSNYLAKLKNIDIETYNKLTSNYKLLKMLENSFKIK